MYLTRNLSLEEMLNGGRMVYDVRRTEDAEPVGSVMLGFDNQWRIVGGNGTPYGMIVDAANRVLA